MTTVQYKGSVIGQMLKCSGAACRGAVTTEAAAVNAAEKEAETDTVAAMEAMMVNLSSNKEWESNRHCRNQEISRVTEEGHQQQKKNEKQQTEN